jgi:uncharacterized alkaline shock family protein YloU
MERRGRTTVSDAVLRALAERRARATEGVVPVQGLVRRSPRARVRRLDRGVAIRLEVDVFARAGLPARLVALVDAVGEDLREMAGVRVLDVEVVVRRIVGGQGVSGRGRTV